MVLRCLFVVVVGRILSSSWISEGGARQGEEQLFEG